MLTRITYNNFGTVEHMFFSESESDAHTLWCNIWGGSSVNIISVGEAVDTDDFGGFIHS